MARKNGWCVAKSVGAAGPACIRLMVALTALLVAACGEGPPDALAAARQAIESAPNDPAPRVALARLYLDQRRGDLAEVLIDQAIERGANARELLPERAEALRIAGKTAQLDALPLPEQPTDRARILASRAKAEPSDATYQALYAALDHADLPAIRQWADAEPASARARAHHNCTKAKSPAVYTWDHPFGENVRPGGIGYALPASRASSSVVMVRSVQELEKAARSAPDGATIEIEAKDYPGAVAEWRQNQLTVRGVGGRAHISAAGGSVEDRDAWLFSGNDITVENVEISGARSHQNKNGASIRFIGSNLTLRHVYLHDSENGLLTGNGHPDSKILIEYSEFARNGDGEGYAHNVYVGVSAEVMFRFNYSHESNVGHLFKSRAARTVVAYNYLADHDAGTSSRSIDLPDGGRALVIGNVIDHGANSVNRTIIGYGTENPRFDDNALQIINNTFYNRYLNALAIDNRRPTVAQVVNNLFAGAPLVRLEGVGRLVGNIDRVDHGLAQPHKADYSITAASPAVDTSVDPTTLGLEPPAMEYVHPVSFRERVRVWNMDVGAYERCGF
jgi:hypothetical protein